MAKKSSYYPENCCEDESGRFVAAGRDELCDHACDEPDDDRPYDVHGKFPKDVASPTGVMTIFAVAALASPAWTTLSNRLGVRPGEAMI